MQHRSKQQNTNVIPRVGNGDLPILGRVVEATFQLSPEWELSVGRRGGKGEVRRQVTAL